MEGRHIRRAFLKCEPGHGARGLAKIVVMDIGDDADNLPGAAPILAHRDGEAAAERGFVFEKLAGQRLIDNCDHGSARLVGGGEIASGKEWDADRLEKARGDSIQAASRGLMARSFDWKKTATVTAATAERTTFSERDGLRAGYFGDPAHEFGREQRS